MDEFDQKTPIYGWTEVTSNKYAAHDSGVVTQLFANGEDLGSAQSAHTDLNVEGEWFYNSAEDVCYYYSASTPLDLLLEGWESKLSCCFYFIYWLYVFWVLELW